MTTTNNFATSLIAEAKRRRQRIILPESNDTRVLAAATRAQTDGIADCILLGDEKETRKNAQAAGINLSADTMIVAPDIARLAPLLASLRASKGMDETTAAHWLSQDPVAAAAIMLKHGEADGMVAGAATASAAVLRPFLQIIGKAKNASLASSFFLMCLPEGAKLFADCALNVRPTAAQLADIAAQSAANAQKFGITPIVALLSYATGDSTASEEVARIAEATELAQKLLPNTPVVGPIQYDAAISPTVAAQKAPQWKSAGHATVLIFPDVASGNIAYKAVQHAAKIVAIGPLLQGLAAPANDLSRGATIDDVYYTIAATAIQAGQT
ncbi:MAG: phosphate acetyltransferase [Gammaproteobacteria bacterium]